MLQRLTNIYSLLSFLWQLLTKDEPIIEINKTKILFKPDGTMLVLNKALILDYREAGFFGLEPEEYEQYLNGAALHELAPVRREEELAIELEAINECLTEEHYHV